MQKAFITTTLGLLFSALASRPSFAIGDELVKAHIPFSFHIANTTLPAGDYVIRATEDTDPNLLEIRKDDGGAEMFFLTLSANGSTKVDEPRLVFDQRGEEKFLRQILLPGGMGNELTVSAEETRAALAAARAAARTAPAPTESGE